MKVLENKLSKHSYICIGLMCLSFLFISCGSDQPSTPNVVPTQQDVSLGKAKATPTVILTATNSIRTPTATIVFTKATKEAVMTRPAQDWETAVAGPSPTIFFPPSFPTDPPQPTEIPGVNGRCVQANPDFIYGNCWNGFVDGQRIYAAAGALRRVNPGQGVIAITTADPNVKEQVYNTPTLVGTVWFVRENGYRLLLLAENGTSFLFNMKTRSWEQPGPCQVYPIAISSTTVQGAKWGTPLNIIQNGSGPGNFGWLSWTGNNSTNTLATSLTPPGDSVTYTNPDNPNDHNLVVGKWVSGLPGKHNGSAVTSALDGLINQYLIVVPIWDQAKGNGSNTRYHISGFAWVKIKSHTESPDNSISAIYLAPAICQ